jgi:hypothetical protein
MKPGCPDCQRDDQCPRNAMHLCDFAADCSGAAGARCDHDVEIDRQVHERIEDRDSWAAEKRANDAFDDMRDDRDTGWTR